MVTTVIRLFLTLAIATWVADCCADVLPPVSERYHDGKSDVPPDFQRHVLPLMGRLGCNGRACHGSFQGQGGFRLSLFGYDFDADHQALTAGDSPRVDLKQPQNSLILQKPTLAVDHDGGDRFEHGSWQYHLLKQWIATGAPERDAESPSLESLTVTPDEIVFDDQRQPVALRAIARWSDGTDEDVTPLCRFQSNDDSIAIVDETGRVRSKGKGDTHVIVFYDNGVAATTVISPLSDRVGANFPRVKALTEIDRLVVEKMSKVGIVPSEICTDEEFLRRASLDLTGTLPTPEEVLAFTSDKSPNKRAKKVDELLARPSYAAWMTSRICDWLGNAEGNLPVGGEQNMRTEKSSAWYDWIYHRIYNNVPYDELVAGMVLAVSRSDGQTDDEYFQEMSSYFRTEDPADYSQRPTTPFFWSRGRFSPPQAQRFSYAFLGVRLECAQCHKHPYDQWTKEDYEGFKTFFDGVRYRYSSTRGDVKELKTKLGLTADQDSGGYKRLFASLAHSGTVVPWGEVVAPDWTKGRRPRKRKGNPTGRVITPQLLGGQQIVAEEYSDPREPVMQWLREKDNPYFARVLVNRIWEDCFGAGLVNPTDDMNLANPASNEPLMAHLANQFVASGYDLKQLYRTITASDTYQRGYRPNATNLDDNRNFSRAQVRRLPAEVLYDAIHFATADAQTQQQMQTDAAKVRDRQIGFSHNNRDSRYAMQLFGRPARQQTCDCERSNEPSLLQTVYLRNDPQMLATIDRKGGWLDELRQRDASWLREHGDELIKEAYLRTFARLPRVEEVTVAREHVSSADDPTDGLRDLLWALLNSKEFILNH